MKKIGYVDFTQGSIPKHLISFSVPMLLGNMLQALYNTIDSIWVGQGLGPVALGAVSVSFPIMFILISLVMGITMATTVLISQYYGAGDEAMVKKVISNSIVMLSIGAVIVTVAGLALSKPLLRLINTPPDLMPMASSFLQTIMAGMIFMFGYNLFSAILRGLGDSRTPLMFLLYAVGTNIILDPFLIFGWGPFPKLGVAGAALATVTSQALSTVLAIRHLNRRSGLLSIDFRNLKLDGAIVRQTIRIGLPTGVQQMLVSVGMMVITSIINSFGSVVVSAFGAGARLDQFANMPAQSLGLATSALVGQNIGAGRDDRVREVFKWGVIVSGLIALAVTLVARFAPTALLSLFTKDRAVLDAGAAYLRIIAFSYIPFALLFVSTGVLRGAGDSIPAMVFSMMALWLVRVPLAKMLSARYGITGVWTAIVFGSLAGLTLSIGYYMTGRWKNAAVVRARRRIEPVEATVDEPA